MKAIESNAFIGAVLRQPPVATIVGAILGLSHGLLVGCVGEERARLLVLCPGQLVAEDGPQAQLLVANIVATAELGAQHMDAEAIGQLIAQMAHIPWGEVLARSGPEVVAQFGGALQTVSNAIAEAAPGVRQ